MRSLISLLSLLPLFLFAEQTLSFVKPDAYPHAQEIVKMFEDSGLTVVKTKDTQLTEEQAAQFYAVHKDRPFFSDLTSTVSSGPIFVMLIDGDNAIERTRTLLGATDPSKAAPGTVRARFGTSITKNAIHASDSKESAAVEIPFFFPN